MRTLLLAVALVCGAVVAAWADYRERRIGDWITSGQAGHFDDGGAYTAFIPSDRHMEFGVRCLRGKLSVAMLDARSDPKPLQAGDAYKIKVRIDDGPISDLEARAISPRLVQAFPAPELVRTMFDGRLIAARLERQNGPSADFVFKAAGARKALADIAKECGVE